MAAKKRKIWFGFLEAGTKASPVVRDSDLETGDPKTMYLFNFMKGRILEYRRDIVEFKLRELSTEELAMIPELRKAYKQTRDTFVPRRTQSLRSMVRAAPPPSADELPDFDAADDISFDTDLPLLVEDIDEGSPADQMN